jgi:hypothetical protein
MKRNLLMITIILFSFFSKAETIEPSPLTVIPKNNFEPRNENIKIALFPKKIIVSPFSVFTNVGDFITKNVNSAKTTIHSLLSWNTVISEQTQLLPAYQRSVHFGRWVNNSKDSFCYSTRTKVLIRDSLKPVIFNDTNTCTVDTGEWQDPYSSEVLMSPQEIQIDHMVPLKDAYISGAYDWTYRKRCLYGNYLGYKNHLIAARSIENSQKGDETPEKYMPPTSDYKCIYLKDWLFIKAVWGLSMSKSESLAISDLISKNNCDTSLMTISNKEIFEQFQFIESNKDLCTDRPE